MHALPSVAVVARRRVAERSGQQLNLGQREILALLTHAANREGGADGLWCQTGNPSRFGRARTPAS